MSLARKYESFKARAASKDIELTYLRPFADNDGTYGYLVRTAKKDDPGNHFVFCAKDSTKENSPDVAADTVSCHEELINYCVLRGYVIVFMVKDRIFSLVARAILDSKPYVNTREGKPARMLNFKISECNAKELNEAGVWMPIKKIHDPTMELFLKEKAAP